MRYTEEVRKHVLESIFEKGHRICDLSRQLDIPEKRISIWVSKERKRRREEGSMPPADMLTELKKLRKENAELSATVDILKKATAFFASTEKVRGK